LGEPFAGPLISLGSLCYYRSEESLKFTPRSRPGLFAGWHLGHGLSYRDVLLVLDWQDVGEGKSFRPHKVHKKELYVLETLLFPWHEAREKAMLTGGPIDLMEVKDLPFEAPTELGVIKKRQVYITPDRLIKFGYTIGARGKCKGCDAHTSNHSKERRERIGRFVKEEEDEKAAKAAKRAATIGNGEAAGESAPVSSLESSKPAEPDISQPFEVTPDSDARSSGGVVGVVFALASPCPDI
jgi:hypothetical protein